ncbi:DUF1552 domain-containing protein [Coraliomargarita sp. SDUM461003]|uniref:DUF1552 domain-containing protein n=1 Tax=Thalassobacterium maritimum TaxID=3041265 RepID=A0ABU1ATY0_9BACT|nr:DUF1552 domain-containing protein [Coraliomargarita sp. SDUM461003]MDQ8206694.1 DUF1552 domain-containing protein [Coraliomargarita sp. SDUM461003]HBR94543.1 hypothetical protein [Opitutae bacterium]|tara:strand:- start:7812 stop:9158 length:1347 start_codon:yes stop_codon:yes gene_type:complete
MNTPDRPASLSRRAFLRGAGALVALPFLQSLVPTRLQAAATAGAHAPTRMAFIYHPNGVIQENWNPGAVGRLTGSLSRTLEPLSPYRRYVNVISGLEHRNANGNGDGPGDHARATATFLTGAQAKKTGGADIYLGRSFDQVAADHLSPGSRFRSLEFSASHYRRSGVCDSGYSCAYQYNFSWQNAHTPLPPQVNPRAIFKQLYGASDPRELALMEQRMTRQKSVLDTLRADTARLNRKISSEDREQLEEYFTSLRTVERRLQNTHFEANEMPLDFELPGGIPASYREYLDTMYDLMLLAFRTDSTRVITFLQAHDGSARAFPELDIRSGHHQLSHHKGDPQKIESLKRIDEFYLQAFARFLDKLSKTQDGQGRNLIDSCMLVYGGGIGDGNRHNHDNLPVVLAGGAIPGGRHLSYKNEPMCNLYCTMLEKAGKPVERFGDSSGVLATI